MDSSNPHAGDCYEISKERTVFKLDRCENIAMGERGTMNLHVAISQPYDAVALLDKEGTYLFNIPSNDRIPTNQARRRVVGLACQTPHGQTS